jgi:DNA-directed RNA polymerase subunit E'/Rpb7
MDNIYLNCLLTKKVIVKSLYLNEDIDKYIETYLKSKVEGLCIDEGYIKPESVKIVKKSIGMLLGSKFNGDITYDVAYNAEVCNPFLGNVIDCNVKFINKLGILGVNGPITVIVGKEFHINDDEINNIKENDIIKVVIIAKKFSLNDNQIKVIAKLWNNNNNEDIDIKKELFSSDLTPIVGDNDYQDILENNEKNEYDSDDLSEYSIEDDNDIVDDDDDYNNEDINEDNVKLENPDENNLDVDDIELDEDEEDEKDYDEDETSDID